MNHKIIFGMRLMLLGLLLGTLGCSSSANNITPRPDLSNTVVNLASGQIDKIQGTGVFEGIPWVDGGETYCDKFVSAVLSAANNKPLSKSYASGYSTAFQHYQAHQSLIKQGTPPTGAIVYYGQTTTNKNSGHVGIADGQGNLISVYTVSTGVKRINLNNMGAPILGWINPDEYFSQAVLGTSIQAPATSAKPTTATTPNGTSLDSTARSVATDAWAALLNARQGTPDVHLYTTVLGTAPNAVIQKLSGGNSISLTWEDWVNRKGTKGEAEIKNLITKVRASGLSPADRANGITWKGTVEFSFIIRYRAVASDKFLAYPSDIPLPSSNEPFSPWMGVGLQYDQSGNLVSTGELSGVSASVVQQNGTWTTNIYSGFFGFSSGTWHSFTNVDIRSPLPVLDLAWNFYDYNSKPWLIIE